MNDRIVYGFGSIVLLTGAFAVGGVLHQVFVEGTLSLTSPVTVFGMLVGIGLMALGRRIEARHRDALGLTDEEEEKDEFDEANAPFDEADLEKYERDN